MIPSRGSQKTKRIVDAEAKKLEVQNDVMNDRSRPGKSGPTAGDKRAQPTAGKNSHFIVRDVGG